MARHAAYTTRAELTEAELARYRRELEAARHRLGADSPLVNSEAYKAGLRARIVRERVDTPETMEGGDE